MVAFCPAFYSPMALEAYGMVLPIACVTRMSANRLSIVPLKLRRLILSLQADFRRLCALERPQGELAGTSWPH